MRESSQGLELTWIGKDERPQVPCSSLVEKPELSHAAGAGVEGGACDNRVIHGENFLALKALEPEFTSLIQCVYIDPPYNTGGAYAHYEDQVAHSAWLSQMRDRLEIMHALLRDSGVLFISIDDNEGAYLRVLLDEIFGRRNYCGTFVWEKKKKPSFLHTSMGSVTENILVFAKDRTQAPAFTWGTTTSGKKYPLNNAGNGIRTLLFPAGAVTFKCPDRVYEPQDMSEGKIVTRLLDKVEIRGGVNLAPFRLEGEWRYSQERIDEIIEAGEALLISKAPFRPNHVKPGGVPKKVKNLLSRASYGLPTYEDATSESRALFGDEAFDYPKPEGLLRFLLYSVTQPGDWVLDAFAGSGTTGAVAQKMGRRWVMVERGAHCETHVARRLAQVVDGADPGGVTQAEGWRGGGSFRYYEVVTSGLSC